MKSLVVGLLVLGSFNSYANTACMDKIESEIEITKSESSHRHMIYECFTNSDCGYVEYLSTVMDSVVDNIGESVRVKSAIRKGAYLRLALNLENQEFDAPQMRAVLGRYTDVDKVRDIFESQSVCTGVNENVEVMTMSEMKEILK